MSEHLSSHDGDDGDPQGSLDPRLDFRSAQFDPSLALATPTLQPPHPQARALDNLTHVASVLPDAIPKPERQPVKQVQTVSTHRLLITSLYTQPAGVQRKDYTRLLAAREEAARPVLQELMDRVRGPLQLLQRCCKEHQRVRVVTRHARGIRGVATGELWAFDKHMNMVLRDVQEQYTVRLHVLRKDGSERLRPVLEHRQRTLRQIYVRGACVVLVSAGQPAPPDPLAQMMAVH